MSENFEARQEGEKVITADMTNPIVTLETIRNIVDPAERMAKFEAFMNRRYRRAELPIDHTMDDVSDEQEF